MTPEAKTIKSSDVRTVYVKEINEYMDLIKSAMGRESGDLKEMLTLSSVNWDYVKAKIERISDLSQRYSHLFDKLMEGEE